MSDYTPDVWIIIECSGLKVEKTYYRVLAGWYDSYLGDSWKINSGISSIVDRDSHYEVYGVSGSVYKCYKESETFSGYTSSIYENIKKQNCEDISIRRVDMFDVIKDKLITVTGEKYA